MSLKRPDPPPDRYVGEHGEVTATRRPNDHEPELRHGDRGAAHYLATGDDTQGAFGLYRRDMGPGPAGPPPH